MIIGCAVATSGKGSGALFFRLLSRSVPFSFLSDSGNGFFPLPRFFWVLLISVRASARDNPGRAAQDCQARCCIDPRRHGGRLSPPDIIPGHYIDDRVEWILKLAIFSSPIPRHIRAAVW
ncbi:MAG: hypothetical protein LBS77_03820 [Desulfovibrio sp.]|jgi:hypothetical protein|nr:hypothetical protein [Desulfovibrio sp.]